MAKPPASVPACGLSAVSEKGPGRRPSLDPLYDLVQPDPALKNALTVDPYMSGAVVDSSRQQKDLRCCARPWHASVEVFLDPDIQPAAARHDFVELSVLRQMFTPSFAAMSRATPTVVNPTPAESARAARSRLSSWTVRTSSGRFDHPHLEDPTYTRTSSWPSRNPSFPRLSSDPPLTKIPDPGMRLPGPPDRSTKVSARPIPTPSATVPMARTRETLDRFASRHLMVLIRPEIHGHPAQSCALPGDSAERRPPAFRRNVVAPASGTDYRRAPHSRA